MVTFTVDYSVNNFPNYLNNPLVYEMLDNVEKSQLPEAQVDIFPIACFDQMSKTQRDSVYNHVDYHTKCQLTVSALLSNEHLLAPVSKMRGFTAFILSYNVVYWTSLVLGPLLRESKQPERMLPWALGSS